MLGWGGDGGSVESDGKQGGWKGGINKMEFRALTPLAIGSDKIPLVLFAYALQTVITTATCMYDFSQWEGVEAIAKWHLASLYGPYLMIGESPAFFPSWWL